MDVLSSDGKSITMPIVLFLALFGVAATFFSIQANVNNNTEFIGKNSQDIQINRDQIQDIQSTTVTKEEMQKAMNQINTNLGLIRAMMENNTADIKYYRERLDQLETSQSQSNNQTNDGE